MMVDETTETEQIELDLAKTRARMDDRLDELQTRLAPNQLVNDALSHISGGDGSDFTQGLIAKAKANPLPAAVAGVGLVWLMASSQRTANRARSADLPTRLRSAESGVVRLPDEHDDVHASRLDDARGQVLGIARGASDTAASYSQRIKDAVASASQSLRETSHDLGTGASNMADRFGDRARSGGLAVHDGARSLSRSTGSALSSVARNPVALGAVAALVGLVAGALIPVSEAEENALGNFADQVRDKGRGLAQDVVDRGAQVAGDALGAVKDSAQTHGLTADRPVGELLGELTSGDLLGHVKQAAKEVTEAGKDSLRAQVGVEPTDQR